MYQVADIHAMFRIFFFVVGLESHVLLPSRGFIAVKFILISRKADDQVTSLAMLPCIFYLHRALHQDGGEVLGNNSLAKDT